MGLISSNLFQFEFKFQLWKRTKFQKNLFTVDRNPMKFFIIFFTDFFEIFEQKTDGFRIRIPAEFQRFFLIFS